jgi:predicted ABC-type sugar transport system permease subunit
MIIMTQAQAFSSLPIGFTGFGQGSVAGLSPLVILMLVVVVALVVIYRNTELGRWMLTVGANPRAAEFSGVPVGRTIQIGHALSGLPTGPQVRRPAWFWPSRATAPSGRAASGRSSRRPGSPRIRRASRRSPSRFWTASGSRRPARSPAFLA